MANRVLGIEYAGDRIKVVEVGFGRKLKVFNFAVVDNRSVDPSRRAEQLKHTLQTRGFEAKEAVIAASGGNTEHRLLTLPPLSTREMHFVMQRESKKLAPANGADMVWSYEVLKAKEELGIKKNQILLVTAERPMVEAAQNLLKQTRVKLQQVTTIPEAVLNLLRQITAWKKDTVRTIVHFAGSGVHILFAQDGALLLCREIHFDVTGLSQEEQTERLSNELKRSMLYFRQNFPLANPDQIVFSGDNDLLGALATRASDELGISGSIIRFEENLDTSGFRGNWDEFRFHLPSLTASLGAAWRKSPGTAGINLLPGKTQAKEQAGINPTKIARAACILAVVVALAAGLSYLREKGSLDAAKLELAERASIAQPKLEQIHNFDRQRATAEQTAAFLKRINGRRDWTELFRSISFVVPPTAIFDEMRIEGGSTPKLIIRGSVSAVSPVEDFNRFFNALGSLPFFKSVVMPKPTTVSALDSSAAIAQTANDSQTPSPRGRLNFEIECELP